MSRSSSYRQIVRSSSIIGGASVANIVIGLVRMKVAAMLLGPTGVGLIGLLQSLVQAASTLFSLGLGTVGTRQIAELASEESLERADVARRALFWAALALSILGGASFWAARSVLADRALGGGATPGDVGWLAVAVCLSVAAISQSALLKGLRRVSDVAKVSIYSALGSTVFGCGFLLLWAHDGILAFVISAPLCTFLIGHVFVRKLPAVSTHRPSASELQQQWRVLFRVGAGFMISAALAPAGNLAIRSMIQADLGQDALGQYQAAWLVAMTYLGLVLGAMATDYYPRLTAAMRDSAAANSLVNEQSEIALLLAGPILAAMICFAPWIIPLLYSSAFAEAVPVLQWHVLGDVLKVMSWPLGILILAAGDAKMLVVTEAAAVCMYVLATWLGLPYLGVQSTGVAFVAMYALHLPLTFWLAKRRTGMAWPGRLWWQFLAVLAGCAAIFATSAYSEVGGAAFGIVVCAATSVYGAARIGHLILLGGTPGKIAGICQRFLRSLGVSYD